MTPSNTQASADPVAFLADVIGKPWAELASGPDAFDCGGLFGFTQKQLFGRSIPWSGDFVADATSVREVIDAIRKTNLQRTWVKTSAPKHGDAVLMASHAVISHIGVWIEAGPGMNGVLHCERTGGVMLQGLAELEADWNRIEFRRCTDNSMSALEESRGNLLEHIVDGAALVVCRDALNPLAEAEVIDVAPGTSVFEAVAGADIPLQEYWACLNDTPLLRCNPETGIDEWKALKLDAEDVLWILPVPPEGGKGGGSKVLAALVSVVISIAAPLAVGALGGSFVGAGGALSLSGKFLAAGLAIGANLLISSFIPPPPVVAPLANAEPTYSFGALQNQLRPGAVVPRIYGTMRRTPDLLAMPWADYQENEQIIHVLLSLGQGTYDVAEFGFGDTPVWTKDGGLTGAISDLEFEIIEPGVAPTLFPVQVEVNTEVDGVELPEQDAEGNVRVLGPYTAVEVGRKTNLIVCDFVFPRGLFDGDTGTSIETVSWQVQAREIDDFARPTGDWLLLGAITYSNNTTTPQRLTRRFDVPEGRYEVIAYRVSRTGVTSAVGQDVLVWSGLRAHLVDTSGYEDVTALAIRIKANSTSSRVVREWYVEATAILEHFDQDTGELVTGPTEAIDAAALDVIRANYGLALSSERVDLTALQDLSKVWAERGDVCCTSIESEISSWDVLELVLAAGRTKPQFIGTKITFVRDQRRPVVSRVVDHSQMVRGTFEIERTHFRRESPNVVNMQYRDRRGNMRSIECRPAGVTVPRSVVVRTPVMVDPEQVFREGLYMAASNNLRRRFPSWIMLAGGSSLVRGQLVRVSHPRVSWGSPSKIADASEWPRIVLTAPHNLDRGQNGWLQFVQPDGQPWGPISSIGLDDPFAILVDQEDFEAILLGRNSHNAQYIDPRDWLIDEMKSAPLSGSAALAGRHAAPTVAVLEPADDQSKHAVDCLILEVAPGEDGQVEVLAVVENDAVHDVDRQPLPEAARQSIDLISEGLSGWRNVVITGTETSDGELVDLQIDGPLVPIAEGYVVERATSVQEQDWEPVVTADGPTISGIQIPGPEVEGATDISLRVAIQSEVTRGPWSYFRTDIYNAVSGVSYAQPEPAPTGA